MGLPRTKRRRGNAAGAITPPSASVLWSELYSSAVAGDDIVIGSNVDVTYDLSTPVDYGYITIANGGTLRVLGDKQTSLSCKGMLRQPGSKEYVTATYAKKHLRSYTGPYTDESSANRADPAHATMSFVRGCLGMAGAERVWDGEVPNCIKTRIKSLALAGATYIDVDDVVDWLPGFEFELTTTKYMSEGPGREICTVQSISNAGTRINLTAPLQYRHEGRLQYVVHPSHEDIPGSCLSFTNWPINDNDDFGGGITGAFVKSRIAAGANGVLDNRATVGLLTFPIQISAPNDTHWNTKGWGATEAMMGLTSIHRMKGFQMRRAGHAGFLGAYPLHNHMPSYTPFGQPGSGTYLGDVNPADQYLSGFSVRDSTNRGVTIHGTCGWLVEHFTLVNIDTHAIFFEDGSERRNTVQHFVVSQVNAINTVVSSGAQRIKDFDKVFAQSLGDFGYYGVPGAQNDEGHYTGTRLGDNGPSGVWLSSPDNRLKFGHVSSAYTCYWNAFSMWCTGQSRNVDYNPNWGVILEWTTNEGGPCWAKNMSTQPAVGDDPALRELGILHIPVSGLYWWREGRKDGNGNWMATADYPDPYDVRARFHKANFWKGLHSWYGNEAIGVDYANWTLAGLTGMATTFKGESFGGFGNAGNFPDGWTHHLSITNTLDDAFPLANATQFLSYGLAVAWQDGIMIPTKLQNMHRDGSYNETAAKSGCWFMGDFYVEPVLQRTAELKGNAILGVNPGVPTYRGVPGMLTGNYDAYDGGTRYTDANEGPVDSRWKKMNACAVRLPTDKSMFNHDGWWVYNHPMYIDGVVGGVLAPSAPGMAGMNGMLVPATYDYMGMYFGNTQSEVDRMRYTKMQADSITPVPLAQFDLDRAGSGWPYPNMRSAGFLCGGIYKCERPEMGEMSLLRNELYVAYSPFSAPGRKHVFLIFPWNPAAPITSAFVNGYGNSANYRDLTPVASRAALFASANTDNKYFLDTARHELCLHIYTGYIDPEAEADGSLNRRSNYRADGRCNLIVN